LVPAGPDKQCRMLSFRLLAAGTESKLKSRIWKLLSRTQTSRSQIKFRNEIVTGNGGKQILIEDPSGNPIELFQPF